MCGGGGVNASPGHPCPRLARPSLRDATGQGDPGCYGHKASRTADSPRTPRSTRGREILPCLCVSRACGCVWGGMKRQILSYHMTPIGQFGWWYACCVLAPTVSFFHNAFRMKSICGPGIFSLANCSHTCGSCRFCGFSSGCMAANIFVPCVGQALGRSCIGRDMTNGIEV